MATPKSDPITESVEAAAERVADLHEKSVAQSKKASEAYLSSYEKAVVALADTYEKAAGASKIEWVASIGRTTRNVAPWPGALSTVSCPPPPSMNARLIARQWEVCPPPGACR